MYFKEELIGLLLGISKEEGVIKEIIQIDAYPKIKSLEILETPKGRACSGNYWTGYEIAVDVSIEIRLIYTLDGAGTIKRVQSYKHPVTITVVVPYKNSSKTIYELYRMNIINPIVSIEDVSAYALDEKTLQCCILALLEIKFKGEKVWRKN